MTLSSDGYLFRTWLAEQGYEFTPEEIAESLDIALELNKLKESNNIEPSNDD